MPPTTLNSEEPDCQVFVCGFRLGNSGCARDGCYAA